MIYQLEAFANILRSHPELAVFLTLALGFIIGRVKVGNFKLGAMLGTLFAGMIVGQLSIGIPPIVKTIFFDLFLFATGYKVGPQFFYGLKKDALPQLALTVVICVGCLLTAFAVSKFAGYDVGTASGLLAGAFTESTVIGTASDAIQHLSLPDEEKQRLINNIPVAYAVTYLVGTIVLVWFLSSGAPKLLRFNLKEESKKLSDSFAGNAEPDPSLNSAYKEWLIRAFRVPAGQWADLTVSEIQKSFSDVRIMIERIRKPTGIIDTLPDTIVQEGDIIVIAARQKIMLEKIPASWTEVADRELLDMPMSELEIVINKKEIAGKTLKQLAEEDGQGIMLNKLIRGGQEMPFAHNTVVNAGDVLKIYGRVADVERTAARLGFKELKSADTDIVFVGIGIVLGGLIGLLSVSVSGILVTLSTSGGALLMGLIFGWIHSKTQKFGHIPEAALWIFDTMGLATFLGIVGLAAGPSFISGLKQTGFGIILSGIVVALLPHIIGLLVGRFILRMNPVILLGAQCGAGTTTTALKAIQDAAGSKLPVLGYTIPYALGNIILTAWGPVIVSLMTR